ncbi:unnamed protein product [Nesidiocoris tenuis]|uniref:Uncharacterized protein n=1 Tax=Nesidiocoris tenuis TaxID=355587 RepID=A0A6H5GCD4_9HEMI|nr:unnamed protein product [Nesidiocoris tenuis]
MDLPIQVFKLRCSWFVYSKPTNQRAPHQNRSSRLGEKTEDSPTFVAVPPDRAELFSRRIFGPKEPSDGKFPPVHKFKDKKVSSTRGSLTYRTFYQPCLARFHLRRPPRANIADKTQVSRTSPPQHLVFGTYTRGAKTINHMFEIPFQVGYINRISGRLMYSTVECGQCSTVTVYAYGQ